MELLFSRFFQSNLSIKIVVDGACIFFNYSSFINKTTKCILQHVCCVLYSVIHNFLLIKVTSNHRFFSIENVFMSTIIDDLHIFYVTSYRINAQNENDSLGYYFQQKYINLKILSI